jgi:uncharacterized cupredoxin-like copper-binding protein
MHARRAILLPALVLILAACSSGGGSPSAARSAPAASTEASAPEGAPANATRLEVTLTDSLTMEPSTMSVPAGVPVTFVLTNSGSLDHEFYLGDEASQQEHETEMQAGGMRHDEPDGITVVPGETRELTHTFEGAGATLAGCHEPGHYLGGMKATITVTQ